MPSILIIGGGPAGLSAAIYAARAGIQTIVAYKDGGALEKTITACCEHPIIFDDQLVLHGLWLIWQKNQNSRRVKENK